jgi:hypothetical protein
LVSKIKNIMNPAPESPTTSTPPDITILPPAESEHRGNGKIARLPKVLRDQVNRMLDDGVPYKTIIEKLQQSTDPPLPYKFLEINISRWKDHGYQHYVRHQEWRDELRILRESGSEMNEFTDGPKFQEMLVQVALTEIFRVLQQRELKSDSLNFIRLFNALARLNREALGLRKYNDLLAKEQSELKKLDLDREISENEHVAIVDRTDRIFEMPRPRPAEGSAARAASSVSSHGVPASTGSVAGAPSAPSTCPSSPSLAAPNLFDEGGSHITQHDPISHSSPESHSSHLVRPSAPEATSGKPSSPSIENRSGRTSLVSKIENCLDCGSPLPPVPPNALRRPEDHCPNCGIRLPDIGLCYQPGFDHCLNCGATQPHLLPGGERPRPYCHKCGERLHNPEPT